MGFDILAGLLDEKLTKVILIFVRNPNKRFYLSEISKLSDVNPTTTFRILNKLVDKKIISVVVIGKVRAYQLSRSEKAQDLAKMLDKSDEGSALDIFCERMKRFPRVKLVLLDSKTASSAKLIVITEYSSKNRIEKISEEIFKEKNFKITFVELSVAQYESLKGSNMINLDKKVLLKA